jgi:hypothetical protein
VKVSWDDAFPTEWKNKIHVPNHQPEVTMGLLAHWALRPEYVI